MIKFLILSVFLALVSVSTAIPLKKDDAPYWKEQVEKIANGGLDAWKEAVQNKDKTTILHQLEAIHDNVRDAKENNIQLSSKIGKVTSALEKLSTGLLGPVTFWPRMKAISAIVTVLDGNRDNKSYYLLEAVNQWVERRLASTTGSLEEDLKKIQAKTIVARDTLDDGAQVFVQGIKDLKRLTGGIINPLSNGEEVKETIQRMVKKMDENKNMPELYDEALSAIEGAMSRNKE